MSPAAIAALALAMSTDAFAVAVGKGIALQNPSWREALRTGAIFGAIEMATPLIGWLIGSVAAAYVSAWDHWIAFALLGVLGLNMIRSGFETDDGAADLPEPGRRSSFWLLAMAGFATSIDAMAVGVSLAFVDADIVRISVAIGIATFGMVTVGVMLGRVLGRAAGKRAEVVGGVVLIAIGAAIVYEHLG